MTSQRSHGWGFFGLSLLNFDEFYSKELSFSKLCFFFQKISEANLFYISEMNGIRKDFFWLLKKNNFLFVFFKIKNN